jgi:hypothetical protein
VGPASAVGAWVGPASAVRVVTPPRLAVRIALRAWSRGKTRRQLAARLWLRAAVDTVAARALPDGTRVVIAPSLAARSSFARASRLGATCVLVEDLPWLRQLHDDLDRAGRAHPSCRFLDNYRAPAWALVRQEAERVLATSLFVRGAWSRDALRHVRRPTLPLPLPPARPAPRSPRNGQLRVLLAGLATARNGSVEALAAVRAIPDAILLVHPGDGEGLHPSSILADPRVAPASATTRSTLASVDAVLAPTWCESYPSEVTLAAAAGIPVIATRRAAGFSPLFAEVPPGDPESIQRALERLLP